MNIGSFLGLLLFASVSWLAASTTPPFQSDKDMPIREPFRITLSIEHETYSRVADSSDKARKPNVGLILDLRLHFTNQTDKIVMVDVNCILIYGTVIYDSPLVGPSEPLNADGEIADTVQGCPYVTDEKLLRLLPGESFEATQQVKFEVVTQDRFHPPDILEPGEYFLKLTELTWWEIDGQDQNLKEKWKKPGALIGRAVNSELMGFVVEGKPIKRRA
jgi:hypothetical protein